VQLSKDFDSNLSLSDSFEEFQIEDLKENVVGKLLQYQKGLN
jgi:hypothetical protein